jgi:hypothetical protein
VSTAAKPKLDPRIRSVVVNDKAIVASFTDGRIVSMPLHWSYRLEVATPAERRNYYLSGKGYGAHWPDLDEDLSAHGFFTGTPAPRGTIAHRRFIRERKAMAREKRRPSKRGA